jgi:hypothetical protein
MNFQPTVPRTHYDMLQHITSKLFNWKMLDKNIVSTFKISWTNIYLKKLSQTFQKMNLIFYEKSCTYIFQGKVDPTFFKLFQHFKNIDLFLQNFLRRPRLLLRLQWLMVACGSAWQREVTGLQAMVARARVRCRQKGSISNKCEYL